MRAACSHEVHHDDLCSSHSLPSTSSSILYPS